MSLTLIVNFVKDKLDDSGQIILENQDEKCKTFSLEHLWLNTSGMRPLQFYTSVLGTAEAARFQSQTYSHDISLGSPF